MTKHLYTFLKFAGLLALVSMFYLSQVFFEKIFVTRPWKEGFRSVSYKPDLRLVSSIATLLLADHDDTALTLDNRLSL